jgi:hypothetical protein
MFEADLRSSELRKNGVKVKIQELPFRALTLLLSHPDEVLCRDQFRQALWPDGVYVDFGHGISSAISAGAIAGLPPPMSHPRTVSPDLFWSKSRSRSKVLRALRTGGAC